MKESQMVIGGFYGFIGQENLLVYVGNVGNWYQFELHEKPNEVWSEVLGNDLYMIESRD